MKQKDEKPQNFKSPNKNLEKKVPTEKMREIFGCYV